jgi:hypothetical protein
MLRKFGIIAVLSLLALALAAVPAFAVAPTTTTTTGGLHYCNDVANNPNLTVNKTFDANGFVTSASLSATGTVCGAGPSGSATLTSTAIVTTGCVNRGGNEPQGLERTTTTVTGSDTFRTRQGRGSFSVTTNEISPSIRTCPSANMQPVLLGVTFTDITLTVTSQTGTITSTFPNQDP